MPKYHINPETGDPGSCRAAEGNCPFKNADGTPALHFSTKNAARTHYEKERHAHLFEKPRLSAKEIENLYGKKVKTAMEPALRRAFEATLDGFEASFESISDESRAVFGIFAEHWVMKKLGAKKLPKHLHIDLEFEGNVVDNKLRTSIGAKDVQFSLAQINELALITLYDIRDYTFSTYMGYPDELDPKKTAEEKYSLSAGKVRQMTKLAEGNFSPKSLKSHTQYASAHEDPD